MVKLRIIQLAVLVMLVMISASLSGFFPGFDGVELPWTKFIGHGKDGLEKLVGLEGKGGLDYRTVATSEWPVDLRQYFGEIVVRVQVDDDFVSDKREWFMTLEMVEKYGFKVWSRSGGREFVDIQVGGDRWAQFLADLGQKSTKLRYLVLIEDLAQSVFESYPKVERISGSERETNTRSNGYVYASTEEVLQASRVNIFSELFFNEYRPIETINAWLNLVQDTFPEFVNIKDIGQTYEGRNIRVIHLSDPDGEPHVDRKTVVITGGVHSREWISVSSVLYSFFSIVKAYNIGPANVFADLDFLIIPMLNPDGYDYTWTTDRLWRKNRQKTTTEDCFGIDIDHSYDFHWTHSSESACGEEYAGENPFEALESQIWTKYLNVTNQKNDIQGYIDLHSYSQEILYPYAYSCSQEPRDKENLIELAYGIAKAIRMKSGQDYNALPACLDKDSDLIPDLGAGSALDFMYHHKAYWAYQFKLRDSGGHGFLLPSKYIRPVGDEVVAGIAYFCHFIKSDF